MSKMASLILEDGTTFKGLLFGANVSVSGEVGKWSQLMGNYFILTAYRKMDVTNLDFSPNGLSFFQIQFNITCLDITEL